ncbi:GNAT family N-acetyltransferase [Streptomyces sp. NPDC057575]|uniref:GNAT family N-acetyltransferase n=1 Tax=unclassified Streptomyces TaxID=2593676 RepID=UPI0036B0944E
MIGIDPVAVEGDKERAASIQRWCQQGLVVAAEGASGLFGYCVVEFTFFEQSFATTLMVAPSARGRGVGRRLQDTVAASCETQKLFTSTYISNRPLQQLLQRAGWRPVGLLHGLDENDPELFLPLPDADRNVAPATRDVTADAYGDAAGPRPTRKRSSRPRGGARGP